MGFPCVVWDFNFNHGHTLFWYFVSLCARFCHIGNLNRVLAGSLINSPGGVLATNADLQMQSSHTWPFQASGLVCYTLHSALRALSTVVSNETRDGPVGTAIFNNTKTMRRASRMGKHRVNSFPTLSNICSMLWTSFVSDHGFCNNGVRLPRWGYS